nr:esterase-like activity of phytase family protein [uncultured Dyadobacter sp.]
MRKSLLILLLTVADFAVAQSIVLEHDMARFKKHLNIPLPDKSFGGVSGIEYVQQRNKWYFLTDGKEPQRQTYLFEMTGSGADSLPQWNANDNLQRRTLEGVTQAEAVRFDGKNFWICTEEEVKPSVQLDSIFEKGYISRLSEQNWSPDEQGAVRYASLFTNRGYEAVAAVGKDTICMLSEWPVRQDGRYARLTLLACPNGACNTIGEYAYELDINSCAAQAQKLDGSIGNGVSEMLYINNGRFLILERCYDGDKGSVKLYETRITPETTDIKDANFKYLAKSGAFRPLPKQEVFNFNSIGGITVDNLEAMTWGPGKHTLVVVSDNNYRDSQKTQWIVLKVTGGL